MTNERLIHDLRQLGKYSEFEPNYFLLAADRIEELSGRVEVKHGEWLQTKEPLGWKDVDCVECSVCHDSWVLDEDYDIEDYRMYWSFCPNCGARMDKETEVTDNG